MLIERQSDVPVAILRYRVQIKLHHRLFFTSRHHLDLLKMFAKL